MSNDTFLWLIIGMVVVAIISYFVRSFIKIVFVAVLIYLLFHIGFIWESNDLSRYLKLDKWFSPEVSEEIQHHYNSYTEKRNEHETKQMSEIKSHIEKSLNEAWNDSKERVQSFQKSE